MAVLSMSVSRQVPSRFEDNLEDINLRGGLYMVARSRGHGRIEERTTSSLSPRALPGWSSRATTSTTSESRQQTRIIVRLVPSSTLPS